MTDRINWCINEKNCKDVTPPSIANIPGGWTVLDKNSIIIKECIDHFLTVYDKHYSPKLLPDNIKVKIIEAASQVVNGLNIYLKFEIHPVNNNNMFKPLLVKARFYLNIINKKIELNQFSVDNEG